jgi:8-oxo-dGTP diphosphatase
MTTMPSARRCTIIVDCANVMGARADGWWRDRSGAAARLRDDLGRLATSMVAKPGQEPQDIVLVVEGAARGIGSAGTTVRVVDAAGSADDEIVALVSAVGSGTRCLVVTADRELRSRCEAVGATVQGPRWLLSQL